MSGLDAVDRSAKPNRVAVSLDLPRTVNAPGEP
jgi:hypothetical protein